VRGGSSDLGAPALLTAGNNQWVFNKIDGKWLLVRDTWNMDAPPAPAAPAAEPAAEAPAT
jgi:hypothetical protein